MVDDGLAGFGEPLIEFFLNGRLATGEDYTKEPVYFLATSLAAAQQDAVDTGEVWSLEHEVISITLTQKMDEGPELEFVCLRDGSTRQWTEWMSSDMVSVSAPARPRVRFTFEGHAKYLAKKKSRHG